MPPRQPASVLDGHEVTNQPPPLGDFNLFDSDPIIRAAVAREGAGWVTDKLSAFGKVLGSERVVELAESANNYPPELRAFDRFGQRIDEVVFHPSYHELMQLAKVHEVHSIAWTAGNPGGHVAHMALAYLLTQAEPGVCCPITMTYAAVPALKRDPRAADWVKRVTATSYDPRSIPAMEKTGLTIGMAMTEKQGGSDVRSNRTKAHAVGNGWFELTGHKWFCSAPMSDAFLTLARTEGGLSCFLLPRWRPDGSRNPFHLQRLKNKLGDRSNATAEVEYRESWAELVGEEGEGVRTVLEAVHHTRLDTAVAAAGMMRAAVVQAVHHASHRTAFQRRLIDQPLMRNVLADLVVEWVAATLLSARVARSYGEAAQAPFARIAVAIAKYWLNKRLPSHVCEALECLGGSGYVEDSGMPRLYRQAPVNGIWEGSGNVICLDILRSMEREPSSAEALMAELELARGGDRRLDRSVDRLKDDLRDPEERQARARRMAGAMALCLEASLLVQHGPNVVADAFCASRLDDGWGGMFGTLPTSAAFEDIIRLGQLGG